MSVALTGSAAQTPDGYDTLCTRNGKKMLVPKYDTLAQLEKAEKTVDSILYDLHIIAKELGINDTTHNHDVRD